jgi:hypothetical protein
LDITIDSDTVSTASTVGDFFPGTTWFAVNPAEVSGRGWLEVASINGTGMVLQPAVQFANNILAPDVAIALGATAALAVGTTDPQAPTTLSPGTKKWMRFGVLAKVTSGVGSARVAARIQTWNP